MSTLIKIFTLNCLYTMYLILEFKALNLFQKKATFITTISLIIIAKSLLDCLDRWFRTTITTIAIVTTSATTIIATALAAAILAKSIAFQLLISKS